MKIMGMEVVADPSIPTGTFEMRTERQTVRVFVEHFHCPCGCDHPQPFALADGRQYCGACYHFNSTFCQMVQCTLDICID